jgi:hypothetical protein
MFEWLIKNKEWFFSGIGVFVLSILFNSTIIERVNATLVNIIGSLVPERRRIISGLWFSIFWFKGVNGKINRRINVIRIGALWGRVSAKTVIGNDHQISFTGKINRHMYITGKWQHIQSDNIYHGGLQFVLEPEGDCLTGRWLGFNKKQVIAAGPWILIRLTPKLNDASIETLRLSYASNDIIGISSIPPSIINRLNQVIQQQKNRDTIITWGRSGMDEK